MIYQEAVLSVGENNYESAIKRQKDLFELQNSEKKRRIESDLQGSQAQAKTGMMEFINCEVIEKCQE